MKNIIVLFLAALMLASCSNNTPERQVKDLTKGSKLKDTVIAVPEKPSVDPSFKNAAYFGGSGFGPSFLAFIQAQQFDECLKFTSKVSIKEHGAKEILDLYKDLKIKYKLVQKSMSKDGDTITIRYTTREYATAKFKDFRVVVENDTCKLLLPHNLDDFLK